MFSNPAALIGYFIMFCISTTIAALIFRVVLGVGTTARRIKRIYHLHEHIAKSAGVDLETIERIYKKGQ